MFDFLKKKNQENRKFTMPQGLTRDEQRAVREVVKKAQRNDGVPRTAQQSIPFDRMIGNLDIAKSSMRNIVKK